MYAGFRTRVNLQRVRRWRVGEYCGTREYRVHQALEAYNGPTNPTAPSSLPAAAAGERVRLERHEQLRAACAPRAPPSASVFVRVAHLRQRRKHVRLEQREQLRTALRAVRDVVGSALPDQHHRGRGGHPEGALPVRRLRGLVQHARKLDVPPAQGGRPLSQSGAVAQSGTVAGVRDVTLSSTKHTDPPPLAVLI
eukprot:1176702-Prorocentrum_minimum.AAC.1